MVVAPRNTDVAPRAAVMDRVTFKRLLDEHGSSITKIADSIGVNRLTLSRWMNGTSDPQLTAALALARRLDTTVETLWPSKEATKW